VWLSNVTSTIDPELLGGAARFDYETEMLIVASRKGFRIDSVPITRFIRMK